MKMATLVVVLLLASLSSSPLVLSQTQTPCSDLQGNDHFVCELQHAKFRIARLETILEDSIQSLDAKVLRILELDKLIEELGAKVQELQASLSTIKDESLHADERIDALEEKMRLLWDASRKSNFELHILESKAEDAEERLEALTSQVEKMSDIVTEQWIQLRQFEQALQIAEMRALKARRQLGSTRWTLLLQFINGLCGNYMEKIYEVLDPYTHGRGSAITSYVSQAQHQIKIILSNVKQYHHKLQGFIKQNLERSEFTASFANEELVFFMASAIIIFPILGAWNVLSSQLI